MKISKFYFGIYIYKFHNSYFVILGIVAYFVNFVICVCLFIVSFVQPRIARNLGTTKTADNQHCAQPGISSVSLTFLDESRLNGTVIKSSPSRFCTDSLRTVKLSDELPGCRQSWLSAVLVIPQSWYEPVDT